MSGDSPDEGTQEESVLAQKRDCVSANRVGKPRREQVREAVDLLEDVLENGAPGEDARRDFEQARDYAPGALAIWGHPGEIE